MLKMDVYSFQEVCKISFCFLRSERWLSRRGHFQPNSKVPSEEKSARAYRLELKNYEHQVKSNLIKMKSYRNHFGAIEIEETDLLDNTAFMHSVLTKFSERILNPPFHSNLMICSPFGTVNEHFIF